MPRPTRPRKIVAPPVFDSYRPTGKIKIPDEPVKLLYEEYEAIKLADYDLMNHAEASKLMDVSRATFARIYESARRKIASALVEGREIRPVFGNAVLDDSWKICSDCGARYTLPPGVKATECPVCGSENSKTLNNNTDR